MKYSIEDVKNGIDRNYMAALKMIDFAEATQDMEKRLNRLSFLGKFLSVYVTGIYASDKLEKMIQEIGQKFLPGGAKIPNNKKTLFVMTEASEAGGLTVLVSNFIRWDEGEQCSLAFTRMKGHATPTFLKEAVSESGGSIYYLNGDFIEKAASLKELSKEFSKIVIMQHQDDVIPNLAYSCEDWEIPVYMYLHANFSLSYGFNIADKILTLNYYDIEKAIEYRGISKERLEYFQFPNDGRLVSSREAELTDEIDDKFALSVAKKYGVNTKKKIAVTMAEDFKLEDILECSFIDFVEKLVKSRNGDTQYIIIGPHPHTERWRKLEAVTEGNAKAVGYLNRKEASAIIKLADLYIVSFPMSASGNMVAEAFGVPFLTYALTERGRERQDIRTITYSIEELIEKSKDILDGNGKKYILGERENILPKEQWQEQWKNITESVEKHAVYNTWPERKIGTEEIINYQLMQKRASGEMQYFMRFCKLDIDSIEYFAKISKLYNLNIMTDRMFVLEDNYYLRLTKESFFCDYLTKWLILELNGHGLEEYFKKRNIGCISIYGAAAMGQNLYRTLHRTDIKVECFIDRETNRYALPEKLIGLTSLPKESKVIINTAYGNVEDIRKGYEILPEEYEFISLYDIIDEMYLISECI